MKDRIEVQVSIFGCQRKLPPVWGDFRWQTKIETCRTPFFILAYPDKIDYCISGTQLMIHYIEIRHSVRLEPQAVTWVECPLHKLQNNLPMHPKMTICSLELFMKKPYQKIVSIVSMLGRVWNTVVIKHVYSINLPGQDWLLQICDSTKDPLHLVPPFCAICSTSRNLSWVPPPQVAEQPTHALQVDHGNQLKNDSQLWKIVTKR